MVLAAHKIALRPTKSQAAYFTKACGVARFAYNWGLSEWKRLRDLGETVSWMGLMKRLRAVKDEQFPWMSEVTKLAPEIAMGNLGQAFSRFFKGKKGKGPRVGFPKLKKKNKAKETYCAAISNSKEKSLGVKDGSIRLACIGWVRMRQSVRFSGRISRATVSRVAGRWFVTVLVETPDIKPIDAKTKRSACGVDIGITTLATIYDGEGIIEIPGPRPLRRKLQQLRRRCREVSRRKYGSANREKAVSDLARLHAKISSIRINAIHKITSMLARGFQVIGIERLNVSGMIKNPNLALDLFDASFYEFRRQIEYKARWYGSETVSADRYFPSSKTCPNCNARNGKLRLSKREWKCAECGEHHHRDQAAAKNLHEYAVGHTASACGAKGSGPENPS